MGAEAVKFLGSCELVRLDAAFSWCLYTVLADVLEVRVRVHVAMYAVQNTVTCNK